MVDPSHGTEKAEYVPSMAMAAITSGANALMIEVHPNPAKAFSDGSQSLTLERFEELMQEMAVIGRAIGRWPQKFSLLTVQDAVQLRELASRV